MSHWLGCCWHTFKGMGHLGSCLTLPIIVPRRFLTKWTLYASNVPRRVEYKAASGLGREQAETPSTELQITECKPSRIVSDNLVARRRATGATSVEYRINDIHVPATLAPTDPQVGGVGRWLRSGSATSRRRKRTDGVWHHAPHTRRNRVEYTSYQQQILGG